MPSITMELVKMSKEKKAQLVKEVTESTTPHHRAARTGNLRFHQGERA